MNAMTPILTGEPRPFMLRIDHYEVLDRAGTFDGAQVELIGGRLIVVNAQLQAHILVKNRLARRLQHALEALNSTLEAIVEGSLALSDNDLPDPDILLGRMTPTRDYMGVHQVALVIEVADTSVKRDLGPKRDLYATGGVPEYWVVDINVRQVHQFWALTDGRYTESRTVPLDGELRCATMPELSTDGSGIL